MENLIDPHCPINIVANEIEIQTEDSSKNSSITKEKCQSDKKPKEKPFFEPNDYFNGAIFDELNYCWSQTINEIGKCLIRILLKFDLLLNVFFFEFLEIHVRLPENIRSTKQIKVNITSDSVKIMTRNNEKIIDGILAEKCRHNEVVWTITPDDKLNISLG